MNIPITKAIFDEAEREAIVKPLDTGWVVQGPNVAEFERQFKAFTHSQHAKAVSSCTTGLELALDAFGIGCGDKVIVPSLTYIASANVIEHLGATPVFCDVDLRTYNIDVDHLEKLLAKERYVKAIMPVNLFGLCADMPRIMELAQQYNVKVVEDSACGFDAWINGQHSGTFADVGVFSFHPRKAITTGEGGMVITDNEALFTTMSQLCDHGAAKSDFARHNEKGGSRLPDFAHAGYNFRMTDFQGALGVCQMAKAEMIMQGRRRIAEKYDEALAEVSFLLTPVTPNGYVHGYQSYVCLFTAGESLTNLTIEKIDRINAKRNEFMDQLEEAGVATRQGTHAVHTLKFYREKYHIKPEDYLNAYAIDRLSITLPVYATMTDQEFDYVIAQMQQALIAEQV